MRPKNSYIFATTLCALALILGNASHARAGQQPKATPLTTGDTARIPIPSGVVRFDSSMSVFPSTREMVTCSRPTLLGKPLENVHGEIMLKPGQNPEDFCEPGHIISVDYLIAPIHGIPPPSPQQDDGGGH